MQPTAEAEHVARNRLSSDGRTRMLADARFTALAGGFNNLAWRVTAASGDWFVRLARDGAERLGADHVNECRVLEIAAAHAFAPPVVRCDPVAQLLVTHWIEGAGPAPGSNPGNGVPVREMAGILARLHALPVPDDLRHVDFAEQARGLDSPDASPRRDTEPLREAAAKVFAGLAATPVPSVLCHNDLNPSNIVRGTTGQWWLVDWEYAGLGDPVFDLASFASQHELDPGARGALIDGYRRAGGRMDELRLELALWAFDYVQWLWYLQFRARDVNAGFPTSGLRAQALAAGLHGRASRLPHCNN